MYKAVSRYRWWAQAAGSLLLGWFFPANNAFRFIAMWMALILWAIVVQHFMDWLKENHG